MSWTGVAFATAAPVVLKEAHRIRRCSPKRPRRCNVVARASRLLVVELEEILKNSQAATNEEFNERVAVDRKQASDTAYIIYTSPLGYDQATEHIQKNKFVAPDALVAVNGSEIYQQQYRVPDPYWEQTIRSGWDPKPIKWAIGTFFKDEVKERGAEFDQEYELHFERKDPSKDKTLLSVAMSDKLKEMGLTCRVRQMEGEDSLTVVPASGSVLESIQFCQKMLQIEPKSSYVFGCGPFVDSFTKGTGNSGITNSSFASSLSEESREAVFLSEKTGMAGLLDGVLHFAVF